MDILYQLPLPDEICNKIFIFACKTPHTGLAVEVLKNRLDMNHLDIPEKDEDVIMIDSNEITNYPSWRIIHICFFTWFKNLTVIRLNYSPIRGDIIEFMYMLNLTTIELRGTGVNGDIIHLKTLTNLTKIGLNGTGVWGNIIHLKSLRNITEIGLSGTGVMGDITNLKYLLNVTFIDLEGTIVSGNKVAFNEYRKTTGLPKCYIAI